MGSFNTSCMVSQQTIVPGSHVVILPISQQATYNPVELIKDGKETSQYGFANTTCYPTAFWGYAGPMIRGQYDDYGCFELFETPENKNNLITFFEQLLTDAFTTKQGNNEYHDHPFDIHSLYERKKQYSFVELVAIWDKVWDVSQENRLFVCDYQENPRNLQFAVIHQAAADYLINYVDGLKSYNGQSYEQKSYFADYLKRYFNKKLAAIEKMQDNENYDYTFFATQISSLNSYRLGEQEGCYISHHYDNYEDVIKIIESVKITGEELPSETVEALFEISKSQIKHRYLQVGLDSFNIKLSPMVYASQDYDNSIGKGYTKMIKTVSAQVNKQIKNND